MLEEVCVNFLVGQSHIGLDVVGEFQHLERHALLLHFRSDEVKDVSMRNRSGPHSDRCVSRSRLCGFLRLIVTATGQCNGCRRTNGNAREKLLHWSILPSVQTKTPWSRQALRLVNDSSIVHGRLALHGKASV